MSLPLTRDGLSQHDASQGRRRPMLETLIDAENRSFRPDVHEEEATLVREWGAFAWQHRNHHDRRAMAMARWHVILTGLQTFSSFLAMYAVARLDASIQYADREQWALVAIFFAAIVIVVLLFTRMVQPSVSAKRHQNARYRWLLIEEECESIFLYSAAKRRGMIDALSDKFTDAMRESPFTPKLVSNGELYPTPHLVDLERETQPDAPEYFARRMERQLQENMVEADALREAACQHARNFSRAYVLLNSLQTFFVVSAFLAVFMTSFKGFSIAFLVDVEHRLQWNDEDLLRKITDVTSDDNVCQVCSTDHQTPSCSSLGECKHPNAKATCGLCRSAGRDFSFRFNATLATLIHQTSSRTIMEYRTFFPGSFAGLRQLAVALNTIAGLLASILGALRPDNKQITWQLVEARFADHARKLDIALKMQPNSDAESYGKKLNKEYGELKKELTLRNEMPSMSGTFQEWTRSSVVTMSGTFQERTRRSVVTTETSSVVGDVPQERPGVRILIDPSSNHGSIPYVDGLDLGDKAGRFDGLHGGNEVESADGLGRDNEVERL